MDNLFTEKSTQLVAGFVLILLLMRVALALVPATSPFGRFILWFWHPDARRRDQDGERLAEDIYPLTLQNMDSTLVALALVFFVIRPFVLQAFYIPSSSMFPTLYGEEHGRKDRVLVSKYLYKLGSPHRGDIIVFHAPKAALQNSPPQDYIKRLIGLPGDLIEVRGHHAYVNGKLLEAGDPGETIQPGPGYFGDAANFGPRRVPPGHYFVMGDNRANSHDSRRWGHWNRRGRFIHEPFLKADQVLGKAVCVFWPPKGWKLLN
jgi:signal peptidase I